MYAGPTGKTAHQRASRLSSRWVVQPKIDGQYVHLHTDRSGKIFAVTSRTGREIETGLVGVQTGAPYSVLCGELEAHTEAGIRAAETAGYQSCHLFDVVQLDGRLWASRSYRARRDALLSAVAREWDRSRDTPWHDDARQRAHDARGRFCRRVPRGWRRLPVVEQRPVAQLDAAWADWVTYTGGEGVVLVNLDAPIGARRAKLKLRDVDTLDATVLAVSKRRCTLAYGGAIFSLGVNGHSLAVGDLVEVTHHGWHESSVTPRHARVTRIRTDLQSK